MCQEYSSIYKYAVIVNGAIFNNFDTDGTHRQHYAAIRNPVMCLHG